MNPTELRMMWMSQYNPERISLEDATSYFGHPTVGLSVMDDVTHQQTMDLNPMMSIVGGDFSGQAAAAAALGVHPTALITTNSNDIYGIAQVGGLHQQILQQSAAAVFQNYSEINEEDDGTGGGNSLVPSTAQYITADQQEIINIDDFVMMTDSNSYDGTDFMQSDKDLAQTDVDMSQVIEDTDVLASISSSSNSGGGGSGVSQKIGGPMTVRTASATSTTSGLSSASGHRSQRKTRKIEPVNRPGLVLKTPIAYKGNIDPSVIPIQKDGMAVCERCGAIGVKHTFYTKSRRFCSMSCARGELYSLVVNNKMSGSSSQQQQAATNSMLDGSISDAQNQDDDTQSDIELALRVAHIKNSNFRFRLADDAKVIPVNGLGDNGEGGASGTQPPKPLRLYRDVIPTDELPHIPKYDRLPVPCPQMEKIISIRRRLYDPTHSYDWTPRLSQDDFFAAPVTCFPHAPGYEVWDNIGVDMKVEVENTDCDHLEVIQPGQTPHSFWVATILNISGYKALMRYEGFDEPSHDFWVNLCNAEVHSVGWCATRGKPLIPPRSIENKYSDWKDFLVERLSGARTLPSSFYNKINDSMQSRFRIGLNLECVDKDRISQVRLATVTKIVGKRLFLRYFDSDDGFWCHEDSPIIHPVGWATTVGHNLAAPQNYLQRMIAGREDMIEVHEDDATIELFKMNFTFEEYYLDGKNHNFEEYMKLEAVDPLNLSSICAATVMATLKFGYMMIRIDSYQPDATDSDWFCYHEKSPSIFPVGFCASNNITLTPPNGYDTATFNWDTYLKETGSIAAGQHLFHRIVPDHRFEVGMSLECADLMDPRLVCVATVSRVVGRLLKIHFDGWTDEYDQWLDCESPDVYPVGWCVLVNHKLEGPPQPQQPVKPIPKPKTTKKRKKKIAASVSSKSLENASAAKSRSIAVKSAPHVPKLNIKVELKPEHHNAAFYDNNDHEDEDEFEEDGVAGSDSGGHHPQSTPQSTTIAVAEATSGIAEKPASPHPAPISNHSTRTLNTVTMKKAVSPAPPTNSSVSNSKYIPRLSDLNDASASSSEPHASEIMPETWNVYDVSQFLRVNDCTAHCDNFSRNKIDGKRFMQLSKDEIVTLLGMKVGPALKIFDLIQQLKCKINPSKSRYHKANKAFL